MQRGARRKATGVLTSRFRKLARAVERALSRSGSVRSARCRSAIEALENRRLLAAGVVINEFMANNNTGYTDPAFPGAHPDWIELYNPTTSAVSLQGWQLKDGPNLTTWTFPAGATIGANSYLIVAADSKNLTNPAAVMHTNFNLSSSGEYLGLFKANSTVANEFAPYPAQSPDISYGILQQNNTLPLISPTATLKATVPANGSFDTANPNWKSSTYDDTGAAWINGQGGVGFDANPTGPSGVAGWNVKMVRASSGDFSNIALAKNVLDGNTAGFTVASTNTVTGQNHIDYVEGGHFSENNNLPDGGSVAGGSADVLREEYAIRASAYVTIPAGTYTIGVNSDDGFQLTIPGVTFTNRLNENYTGLSSAANQITFGAPRGSSDTLGTFTLTSALSTTITADMYEQHGGDNFEVFIAPGSKSSVDNSFSLVGNGTLGWTLTTAPPNVPYAGQFGLNLQSQMLNHNASAYIRIAFNVDPDDLSAFESLLMHVKYDDGFVAWINGQQVASVNAPASPSFNSTATADNPNAQAVIFRDFNIPSAQTYIHAGLNVLAIQALNITAADQDFLSVATLEGVTGTIDVPRFFSPATPGATNTGAYAGRVADTKFDHDRGFYSAPFQLTITDADTADGAVIRYTTDGSTPSPTNGTIYTGPITINKTSTIRAAAFRNGYLPTDVDTQTYIFLSDVITQSASNSNSGTPPPGWPASWSPNTTDYGMDPDVVNNPTYGATIENDLQTIPTLSIVTDLNNLFGNSGLYSNPSGSGIAWERPASLELINPDGTTGFQINAGLRLRGGYSRSTGNPKHGLRILLRDTYGSTELNYPLFQSMDGTDATRGFDVRTFENYSWSFEGNGSQFIGLRDQFSRDTQLAMGHNAERGDMYNLYIDGQYWGIYNTDERPEADYGVSYYGGNTDDYDTIKVDPQSGYTIVATDGNTTGWNNFWTLANQLRAAADAGQDTTALYQKMMGNNPDGTRNAAYPVYLDATNLIDYMLDIFYGGNLDAPISNFLGNTSPNNYYAIWNHTTKAFGFQFFAHDSEHTLLDVNSNRLGPFTAGVSDFTKSNPQEIFQQLLYNPDFRMLAADRIHKFLFNGGALTPEAALARFNDRRDEINRAIVGESARWGDSKTNGAPLTYANWQGAIATVSNNFLPGRTNVLLNQFKNQAMGDGTVPFTIYPSISAPEFVEQFGGDIGSGKTLHLTNLSGGTIYYTTDGSDPRLPGGALNPSAQVYNDATGIALSATARVQARVRNGTTWSAVTDATFTVSTPPGVRITEIMYHPVTPPAGSPFSSSDFEYIEFQNITAAPINLKDFALTHGVSFTFPNMVLAAGARTVVVANQTAFQSLYGNALPIAGVFSGNLDNGGEKITFNGPLGQVIQSFTYSDNWYPQTDGEGFSLVSRDLGEAIGLYDSKQGWRASNSTGGDPDSFVAALNPGSVVINEVGAKTATPNSTFIELANTSNSPIDISGWFLSNDSTGANLKKYQFPSGTIIAANGYLLLSEQTSYGQAGNPAALLPFTLDGDGADTITLSQADAAGAFLGYREIQDYGAADVGQTLGRYVKSDGATDFVIQKSPTPGTANAGPATSPIIINEVMYNPLARYTGATPNLLFPNPNLEYIELRNTTNAPIQLDNWKLNDGVNFTFPLGTMIPAYGYVVVSNLLAADFRTAFNAAYGATALPASVAVYGPMSGFLNNGGEKISLQRPGTPVNGVTPYINVDRLSYDNKSPWPTPPSEIIGGGGGGTNTVSLIGASAVWKYKDDGSNQGTAWIANNFNDSTWASGPAQLGYSQGEENDEATLINSGPAGNHFITTYFRKSFNVANVASLNGVTMHLLVDDGAEVYLNGQALPVASINMPGTWDYSIPASASATENQFVDFTIDPSKFVEGTNYFAVEVHQVAPTSSDVSFDLRLDGSVGAKQPAPGFSLIRKSPLNYGNDPDNWQASAVFPGAPLGFTPGAANVANTAPTVNLGTATATINENTVFTLNGSITDPDVGQAWPTQQVDWGDGTIENFAAAADHTFSLTHAYKDNAAAPYTVTVTVQDDQLAIGVKTASVTVNNVAPVIETISDQSSDGPFVLNFSKSFTDPGINDTFTGTVDWDYHPGDSDAQPLAIGPANTFLLNYDFASAGVYHVHITITDKDGGAGVQDFTVTVGNGATPPDVTSIDFLYANGPRNISIAFNEDVQASLSVDDLTIHNVTSNTDVVLSPSALSYDSNSNVATWTFASLTDGNYHATLNAAGVMNASNQPLAQDATLDFFWLNGDANRDRSVGFSDLVAVAQHYGQNGGGTLAGGDMDGDGNIGFSDLVAVAQNYGKSLAPLPAPLPASAPVSSGEVNAPESSAPASTTPPTDAAIGGKNDLTRTVQKPVNAAQASAPVNAVPKAPVKPVAVSHPPTPIAPVILQNSGKTSAPPPPFATKPIKRKSLLEQVLD